jgi:hypothetical protein
MRGGGGDSNFPSTSVLSGVSTHAAMTALCNDTFAKVLFRQRNLCRTGQTANKGMWVVTTVRQSLSRERIMATFSQTNRFAFQPDAVE